MFSNRQFRFLNLLLIIGLLVVSPVLAVAQVNDPAKLLPDSTIFYAEISNPPVILDGLLEHTLVDQLKKEEAYQAILQSPQAEEFLMVLDYVESQIGMEWDDAIKALSAGGITVAFDAASEGAALFIKAKDEKSLEKIVQTVLELARKDAADKGRDDPYEIDEYREITTYGVKNGGFAVYEDWFVFVTNEELGQILLDGILDGSTGDSLADNERFQEARSRKGRADAAWAYVDLKTIREVGLAKEIFSGKTDHPLVEILFGGILEVLKETSYLSASVSGNSSSAQLRLTVPYQQSWISESREFYFGPRGAGRAKGIPEIPQFLFAVSAYRDFSEMWLRAGDLFNERVNDKIAEADSTLTTFFSGKDFGEDILGSLAPEVLFVAGRQKYPEDGSAPTIKIPTFAVMAEMKDPKTTTREFRRVFQSLIGFFNVVGVQNGQPQMELDFEKLENGELISASFIPEAGADENQPAKLHFNFSPTIAFAGKSIIIASTAGLARELVSVGQGEKRNADRAVNVSAKLSASVLKSVLEDNMASMVSQNMLEKGHSKEEAQNEIELLLKLLGYFQNASLSLATTDDSLSFELEVEIAD